MARAEQGKRTVESPYRPALGPREVKWLRDSYWYECAASPANGVGSSRASRKAEEVDLSNITSHQVHWGSPSRRSSTITTTLAGEPWPRPVRWSAASSAAEPPNELALAGTAREEHARPGSRGSLQICMPDRRCSRSHVPSQNAERKLPTENISVVQAERDKTEPYAGPTIGLRQRELNSQRCEAKGDCLNARGYIWQHDADEIHQRSLRRFGSSQTPPVAVAKNWLCAGQWRAKPTELLFNFSPKLNVRFARSPANHESRPARIVDSVNKPLDEVSRSPDEGHAGCTGRLHTIRSPTLPPSPFTRAP